MYKPKQYLYDNDNKFLPSSAALDKISYDRLRFFIFIGILVC